MNVLAQWVLGGSLVLGGVGLGAQSVRDPTQPPPQAMAPPQALATPAPVIVPEPSLSVVVREGVYYVVQGTRLVTLGQQLGDARIERISETEIWLRRGGVLTKRALFAGVSRRPIAQPPSAPLSRPSP